MPISLTCPKCNGKLRVNDHLAGKKIKCPKCEAVVAVTAPEEAAITAESPPAKPGGIAAAISGRDDDEVARPRKKARNIRRDPAQEAVSTIIPYKNGRALLAYYLGVFSFIPCVGLILGPAALVLGILGIRFVKANPTAKGTGHALAGIIMGSLTTMGYWGILLAMVIMSGFAALMGGSTKTSVPQPMAKQGNPTPPAMKPGNQAPPDPNAPLFEVDRDLLNPLQQWELPREPGRLAALRVGKEVRALAFSADGKTLAVANQDYVKLWDVAMGKSRTISVPAKSLAFSPDGKRLAVGQFGGPTTRVDLYDTQTLAQERTLFESKAGESPEGIAFSPDGTLFAATAGTTFHVWDTATWHEKPVTFQTPNKQITALLFDPHHPKTLIVATGLGVLFFDAATMNEQFRLKAPQPGFAAVALSPDGQKLVTSAHWGDMDLFDVAQRRYLRRIGGRLSRAHSLAFTPDNKVVISAGTTDGAIKLTDVATGNTLTNRQADAPGKQLTAFAVGPDGAKVVSGDASGILKVWDVNQLRGPGK